MPYTPLDVWKAKTSTSLVAYTYAPQTVATLLEDMIRPNDVQSLTRFLSKVSCPESHRTQKGAGTIISFYVFVCMWVCSQPMNCGGPRCWSPWVEKYGYLIWILGTELWSSERAVGGSS